jgi:ribonuclease-3
MSGSATSSTDLATLEARLGYSFRDPALLRLALSHASASGASNERLEFLGDRVLGLVIAERLYRDFPNESEGGLAVRLNALVRRETCARIADAIGLGEHLVMASSESGSGGRQKQAILAGACEAVIAAIYLDGGLEPADSFIQRYWDMAVASLSTEMRDAKTALQEWAQSGVLATRVQPALARTAREGPDHAPVFTVEVTLPGTPPERGEGPSKRDAEQDAARRMLNRLGVWKS